MSGSEHKSLPDRRIFFLAGFAAPLLILLSYVFLGRDAHVHILDNIETEHVMRTILVRDHRTTPGDGVVQQIMNGIPRSCLPSDLNVTTTIHRLLPPLAAYLTNLGLVLLIGYVGTWLLLGRKLLPDAHPWIHAGVAACYSSLTVFPEFGISSAGLPLLLFAMWLLRDREKFLMAGGIIFLFVTWSSLYLVGFFLVALFGLAAIAATLRDRRIHWPLFMGVFGMAIGYLVVEHLLIWEFLVQKSFANQRSEHAPTPTMSFRQSVISTLTYLYHGFYHAPPASRWMIYPLFTLAAVGGVAWLRKKADAIWKRLLLFTACIILICTAVGFTHWEPLELAFRKSTFFSQFNRERIYLLLPLFWYCLLALAAAVLWRTRLFKWAAPLLVGLQYLFILSQNEDFSINARWIAAGREPADHSKHMTYSWRNYFPEETLTEIEHEIGRDMSTYRIACIGMAPAAAQHHGFFTLDFYNTYYPLEYKHKFRRLIEGELAKSEDNRKYFDDWGNRCHVFVAEKGDTLHDLALNMDAFRDLGGEYLISVPFIQNARELDLALVSRFDATEYPKPLHLYEVLQPIDSAGITLR